MQPCADERVDEDAPEHLQRLEANVDGQIRRVEESAGTVLTRAHV